MTVTAQSTMRRNNSQASYTRLLLLLWLLVSWQPADVASSCAKDVNVTALILGCSSLYRCEGSCGKRPTEHAGQCGCDPDCEVYGDCCEDYRSCRNDGDLVSSHRNVVSGGRCRYTYFPGPGPSPRMFISQCHSDWQEEGTKARCENITNGILSLIPVTDISSRRFYNNIFCARCNFVETESKLAAWKPDVKCLNNITDMGSLENLTEKIASEECHLILKPPGDKEGAARDCFQMVTTTCDPKCSNQKVRERCELWPVLAPIVVFSRDLRKEVAYKNEYCAACTGTSLTSGWASCRPTGLDDYTPNLGQFSFALLVDFDSSGCIRVRYNGEEFFVCDEPLFQDDEELSGEYKSVLTDNNTIPCNETVDAGSNCTVKFFARSSGRLFVDSKYSEWLGALSLACVTCSIICLFSRVVLQFFVPCFQSLGGRVQLCLCLSILAAMLAFVLGPLVREADTVCKLVGILMHWAFLASFFWMNVIAVDMWRIFRPAASFSVRTPGNQRRMLLYFCMYAWFSPLAIVVCAYSLDVMEVESEFRPFYGVEVCWITQKPSLVLFFGVPMGVFILVNSAFYVITAWYLHSSMALTSTLKGSSEGGNYHFSVYVRLFVLMGSAWISAYIAIFVESDIMWAVYTVLTSTQGIYVSLAAICTRQVMRSICKEKDGVTIQRTQKTVFSTSKAATQNSWQHDIMKMESDDTGSWKDTSGRELGIAGRGNFSGN